MFALANLYAQTAPNIQPATNPVSPPPINLQLGQSLHLPFRPETTYAFQLELKAGDYLHIEVAKHDPAQKSGWGVRLLRPDQKETWCYLRNNNRDKLQGSGETIAEISGAHRLEIWWWGDEPAPAAELIVSVREWRRATVSEMTRLQTVKEAKEIINLYFQQTPDALRDMIARASTPATTLQEFSEFDLVGNLHYYAGLSHHDLGEYRVALQCYQRARKLFQRANNKLEEAAVLTTIGETLHKQSQFQEALDAYSHALPLWEKCHPETVGGRIGWVLTNIGSVYVAMGEYELALTYYQRALADYQKLASSPRERDRGIGTINARMGQIQSLAGNGAAALGYYQQAVAHMKKHEGPTFWGRFYARLGEAYASTGDTKTAEATMKEGLRIWQEAGDPFMQAAVLTSLGKFYLQQGEHEQSSNCLQQALTLQTSLNDHQGKAETLYQLSQLESSRNQLKAAADYVTQAIQVIEGVRNGITGVDMRTSFLATAQDYYALQLDLLMRLHREEPQTGYNVVALQVSESARARSLLDLLNEAHTDIRSGVDAKLLAREHDLQQALTEKSALLTKLLSKKDTAEQTETIRTEIKLLRAEYEQVLAQIRASSPKYAALTQPQPLRLSDIQRELDADTLLLEYALGEKRSYLWAVSQHSLQSYELPGRAQIEPTARRVYELLTAHNRSVANETPTAREARLAQADREFAQEAGKLSRILLEPIKDQSKAKRLLIIADGALHYVPFAALPTPVVVSRLPVVGKTSHRPPTTDNRQPLIANYEIIQLPSATTLGALRQRNLKNDSASQAIAIFADPVFDESDPRLDQKPVLQKKESGSLNHQTLSAQKLERALRSAGIVEAEGKIPRLLFTRREAEAISRLLPAATQLKALDFAANRQQVLATDLSRYRMLHFATHGLVDSANPELSGILLSLVNEQGQAQDGMLRLQDIYNLRLNADLVVISACQTAIGKEVRGEGLMSLSRGFLYAGSKRVISTLWKVDDRASAELMSQFYQSMLGTRRNAAQALRAAQMKLLQNPRWKSPRYWAAFIQQGDW